MHKDQDCRLRLTGQPLSLILLVGMAACWVLTAVYWPAAAALPLALLLLPLLARYPETALYAIIFLIPFGAYRQIGGSVRIHWLLAMLLLGIAAWQLLRSKQLPKSLFSPAVPCLFFYLTANVLAAPASRHPATAWHTTMLLAAACLFVLLLLFFADEKGYRRTIPSVLIASVSLGSLLALTGFGLHVNLFAEKVAAGEFTRGVGGSLDPNNMAIMIIFILPFVLHRLFTVRTMGGMLLYLALLILNLAGLVTTYSRGGLLALVLLLILMAWEYRKKFRLYHLGFIQFIAMAIFLLAWATVPESYWHRQSSLIRENDFSLQRRASYLTVGWEAFKKHPLLGNGPGTFRDIYADSVMGAVFERKDSTRRRYAHNTYLEVLVGSGLLGLTLFLVLLAVTLASFSRARAIFLAGNDTETAELTGCYRIAFVVLAIYLFIFSELFHKHLLLSIGLSQVALCLAQEMSLKNRILQSKKNSLPLHDSV